MREEMEEWLALKTSSGKCSTGLLHQLVYHYENRTLHVHQILDEIAILEGVSPKRSLTKPESELGRPPLRGLWHKHFMQPAYIAKNLVNYWNPEKLEQLEREVPRDRWIHHFVIEGYSQRAGNAPPSEGLQPALTGQWIVFAKHQGINYYLTLGRHAEDEEIWRRCRACAPEFPDLSILQEDRLKPNSSRAGP
ncbi:hypothetical protein AAFX91_00225 [Bradyrhizobium sp. 31Argb]|uniref:hypothetical protein n=1 Tax=Bradyrhizobium sp. 31Argb TaxID=3141247 RepID=UPI00374A0E35